MSKHYRKENDCLNCGAVVTGKFCANCGQENLDTKENFWHFLSHNIGHYFHVDSKFFKSIVPLLTKPGYLTNEYSNGRRASHFPAASMYLFVSLIYFILFFKQQNFISVESDKVQKSKTEVSDTTKVLGINIINNKNSSNKAKVDSSGSENFFRGKRNYTVEKYEKEQKALKPSERDNFLTYFLNKRLIKIFNGHEAQEHFVDTFVHNIPKMMFLLLPLFAVGLKLFYYRSRKFYVEHLVHSLHLHTFLFILFSVSILINFLPLSNAASNWLVVVVLLISSWYIYRSFRTVYGQSRMRTLTKMFFLYFFYALSLTICLGIVAMITIATI
ncbi:DUF3667 domain-containing protein [Solitalea sp. MAHUQ-68]|uniref:DUF3667 domain-containing protein n=1 Tax=Solitalea agri TaxID=2953739 RepID=A0A9X2EYV1_9SPHI|nr:DUF3667 domain-containing protein [Solitalea agri]MCO4291539.1 DUF3667 domain-containing protein [Solitalea agri]